MGSNLMKASALCLAFALWLCGAPVAGAVELRATVPGHPGLTYFDLAKRVVTDLGRPGKIDGGLLDVAVGHKVVPFTHIEGKGATGEPADTIKLDTSDIDAMAIPGDPSRIVLLVDLGVQEGFVAHAALLALFSLAPAPRLLDVVEVGRLEFTGFVQRKPVMLAPATPLILIASEHDVADEDANGMEMIFIRSDRFQFIGAFLTRDEKLCTVKRMEPWSVSAVPGAGPYAAIDVSVRESVTVTGEEGCGDQEKPPRARAKTYRAIYRWDQSAQRFTTQSTELKQLLQENDKPL